ncbi:lipid IV(A) 3-deoxy-D-manno-octulosonic acid transferase [Utexia brackfieldae]|uniref:lipid IV(A) 3-deoxy-D-manno-octulosonic acid transferase n=1 Tax=Utexia brackfieldae TaxID=3074108 RepID=UPI00370D3DD4
MQYFYTFLLYLIQPFVWIRLLCRSIKAPAYRHRWLERYGFCRHKVQSNGILIHAVSVGETAAAVPLIKALKKQYPDMPITVTTMTPTGSERVTTLLGQNVSHVYLPYDLPGAVNRFINTLKPQLVIIIETELWPNFITALYQKQIPLIIANARLSERSAKGYAKFAHFTQTILSRITLIAAQNEQDGQRFIDLGLPTSHLTVTGSIKYDISLQAAEQDKIAQRRDKWQLNRPVWIAASTHSGEDEIILSVHQKLLHQHPDLLLILVPRHPERFKEVEKQVINKSLDYVLLSQQSMPTAETAVLLGDTMGELVTLYGLSDIAFIGGSLVERGGHNPLEAALHKIPIITGPYTFNFKLIFQQLQQAGGVLVANKNPDELYHLVLNLIDDKTAAQQMGECAYQVLRQNQGALGRLLKLIQGYITHA